MSPQQIVFDTYSMQSKPGVNFSAKQTPQATGTSLTQNEDNSPNSGAGYSIST